MVKFPNFDFHYCLDSINNMAIMEMIDKIENDASSIKVPPPTISDGFEVMFYYNDKEKKERKQLEDITDITTDYDLNGLDPDIINLTGISETHINTVSRQFPYRDSRDFVLVTREHITVEYGSFIVVVIETREKKGTKISRRSGSVGSIKRSLLRDEIATCFDDDIYLRAPSAPAYVIGNTNEEKKEFLRWTKYELKGSTKKFYFNVMKIGLLDRSINSGKVDCARIFLAQQTKVNTKWFSRKYLNENLKNPETSYAMRVPYTGKVIELEPIRCGRDHPNYARCFRVAEWSRKRSDKLDYTCSGARIHNAKSEPGLMFTATKVIDDKRYIFAVNSTGCVFESPYSYHNPEYHYKLSLWERIWEWFGFKQEL